MNRFLNVFICCLVVAAACQKNNPEQQDGNGPVKLDDANYLMTNLVFTDDNGNVSGYMVGYGLSEADPGQVSIPCETLEKARELFRSWLPDQDAAVENGENLVWSMTDTLGVSQGSAVLKPGGSQGAMAHLELPSGFPVVTGVQFLPKKSFPQNAELDFYDDLDDFYFLHDVLVRYGEYNPKQYYFDTIGAHGSGEFVVIREYDQDTNTCGIIISRGGEEYNVWSFDSMGYDTHYACARTKSEIAIVGAQYRAYAKYIDKKFGTNMGDYWFLCSERNTNWWQTAQWDAYRYKLSSGELETVSIFHPTFYTLYVYFFSLEYVGGRYKLIFR